MINFGGLGKILILFGLILGSLGVILLFIPKIPWLGKLPGDFVFRRDNFIFYFPLVTCLIISIVLTLIINLFRR